MFMEEKVPVLSHFISLLSCFKYDNFKGLLEQTDICLPQDCEWTKLPVLQLLCNNPQCSQPTSQKSSGAAEMLLKGVTWDVHAWSTSAVCSCLAPALFPEAVWRLSWKIPCSLTLPLMSGSHQSCRKGQGQTSLSGKVTLATPAELPLLAASPP